MGKSSYTGDIDKDLPHFALYVMAAIVTDDKRVQEYLVRHAKDCYRHSNDWGQKIAVGDAPQRDLLINFMHHWFDALMKPPMTNAMRARFSPDFVAHVEKLAKTAPKDRITGFSGNAWPGGR